MCALVADLRLGFYFQMFGMSKIVAERSVDAKEVESSLPLQTTVAK